MVLTVTVVEASISRVERAVGIKPELPQRHSREDAEPLMQVDRHCAASTAADAVDDDATIARRCLPLWLTLLLLAAWILTLVVPASLSLQLVLPSSSSSLPSASVPFSLSIATPDSACSSGSDANSSNVIQDLSEAASSCHSSGPLLLRPHRVMWPGHGRNALVYDCWFSSAWSLAAVGFYHEGEPRWGRDVRVEVDGVDVSGRVTEEGEWPNGRFLTFHLLAPVTAANVVVFTVSNVSTAFHNLTIASAVPARREAVQLSMGSPLDLSLLHISYAHYRAQGFDRIIFAYNGVVTAAVMAQMPPHRQLLVLEWDYEYAIYAGLLVAQVTLLTWSMRRLLPEVEWMLAVDTDEYARSVSGEPIMSVVRQLPFQALWTFRNQFAYAPDGWQLWLSNYTRGVAASPLSLRPSATLQPCNERAKSLYHRSFLQQYPPIIGAHLPLHPRQAYCHDALHHLHVVNYRKGVTTGAIKIEAFHPDVELIPATDTALATD